MSDKVIVISGAGSGFGAPSARALADDGNTVYAGIRRSGSGARRRCSFRRRWDGSRYKARRTS